MGDRAAGVAARPFRSSIERTISKAFLTAHLLTASLEQAENATLQAIDSWNPDEEGDEALLQSVMDSAARASIKPHPPISTKSGRSASYLPAELRAILELPSHLRRCFVLRVLAGLPSEACGRLLLLQWRQVDNYVCAAQERLGSLDWQPTFGLQYAV